MDEFIFVPMSMPTTSDQKQERQLRSMAEDLLLMLPDKSEYGTLRTALVEAFSHAASSCGPAAVVFAQPTLYSPRDIPCLRSRGAIQLPNCDSAAKQPHVFEQPADRRPMAAAERSAPQLWPFQSPAYVDLLTVGALPPFTEPSVPSQAPSPDWAVAKDTGVCVSTTCQPWKVVMFFRPLGTPVESGYCMPVLKYTSRGGGGIRVQCPRFCEVSDNTPTCTQSWEKRIMFGKLAIPVTQAAAESAPLEGYAEPRQVAADLFMGLNGGEFKQCKFEGNARYATFNRLQPHSQTADEVVLLLRLHEIEASVQSSTHETLYMIRGTAVNHDKYAKLGRQGEVQDVAFELRAVPRNAFNLPAPKRR
jgi:hypothetical protein